MQATHGRTSGRRGEHGGVLLFAVIVLSILIVIAATFMATTRQSRAAALNSVNSTMAEVAARAAQADAERMIRWSLTSHSICTPDGVFDPGAANYLNTAHGRGDADPVSGLASPGINPFRYFDVTPADGVDWTDGALLFYDEPQKYNNSAAGGPPRAFYTTSPLAIHAYPSGQSRNTLNWATGATGIVHDDTARLNILPSPTATYMGLPPDFDFSSTSNVQKLKKIGGVRGEYYVWIADLDGKLYGVPQDWGIDTLNTLDPTKDPLSGGPLGGAYDTDPLVAQAKWNANLQVSALAWLNDFGAGGTSATWGYAGQYNGLEYDAADMGLILNTAGGTRLQNVNEFALKLPTLADPAAINYLPSRGATDYYFSVQLDQPNAKNPLATKFCKDFPTAININTASPEVIAAVLSQIPAETDGETLGSADPSRPLKIAKRIVAKRPFLCRMDFEDFLAAQIRGTVNDPAASVTTLPPDGGAPWTDPDDVTWDDPPIAYLLYYGIGRRPGPGTTVDAGDSLYQTTPELTLSQYLEIPGVIPGVGSTDTTFRTTAGAYPNEPQFQLARFRYFFDLNSADRTQAETDNALITVKEFNNIINSVTSIYVNDDIQNQPPSGVLTPGPATVVVQAGPDGVLQTTPQGDDVYDNPNNPTQILAGPNGIPETWVSSRRPSYYSYSNDLTALDNFWATLPTNKDLTVNPDPTEPPFARTVRIYYRLPPSPMAGTSRNAPKVTDLMSWRALPEPNTDSDRRSGFYQMSFDGDYWTSTYLLPSLIADEYGFMQSMGDPGDSAKYSTAKLDSGTVRPPNTTGNGDVSWSPQFAFRSRYYAIYVLGRGLIQKNDSDTSPRLTGEVRMEAVYDALEDRTLWTRTQLSDKRALGEP